MKDAHALENTNHQPKHAINVIKHVHISNRVVHLRQWLSDSNIQNEHSRYRFLFSLDIYKDLFETSR